MESDPFIALFPDAHQCLLFTCYVCYQILQFRWSLTVRALDNTGAKVVTGSIIAS